MQPLLYYVLFINSEETHLTDKPVNDSRFGAHKQFETC